MNEKLLKTIGIFKSPKILIIGGLVGIVLIFISSLSGGQQKEKKLSDATEFTTEEYKENLENDIEKVVEGITGSKNASVIITLEGGIEYSYADTVEEASADKSESSDFEMKKGYITVKTADGGEQALLVATKLPEVRGVAIVCEGGDNEAIKQKIESTVTAALNITSKRVYICGRN